MKELSREGGEGSTLISGSLGWHDNRKSRQETPGRNLLILWGPRGRWVRDVEVVAKKRSNLKCDANVGQAFLEITMSNLWLIGTHSLRNPVISRRDGGGILGEVKVTKASCFTD